MAISIEAALREAHESEHAEGYKVKFRSLKFNLKKNEALRKDVVNGTILPSELVRMNDQELAEHQGSAKGGDFK